MPNLLLGISKKSQTSHSLFKDSAEFVLTNIKWGQNLGARTLWVYLLIFMAIPIAKRKKFLRYLLFCQLWWKGLRKWCLNLDKLSNFNHSGTSGLDYLPSWFCSRKLLCCTNTSQLKNNLRFYYTMLNCYHAKKISSNGAILLRKSSCRSLWSKCPRWNFNPFPTTVFAMLSPGKHFISVLMFDHKLKGPRFR